MRNMDKIIEQTKPVIPHAYQLTIDEWKQLAARTNGPRTGATLDAVLDIFVYGFALGARMQKNKKSPRQR